MNFFQELLGVNTKPTTLKYHADHHGGSSCHVSESSDSRGTESVITANKVLFANSAVHSYVPDSRVAEVVDNTVITHEHVRSSSKLRELLGEMASKISLFHCWGKQMVKVRLNSFMKMLVEQLCIPTMMSIVGIGSAPSDLFSMLLHKESKIAAYLRNAHPHLPQVHRSSSSRGGSGSGSRQRNSENETDEGRSDQRMSSEDGSADGGINTLLRIKYILKEAFTLFKLSEEALLDKGNDATVARHTA